MRVLTILLSAALLIAPAAVSQDLYDPDTVRDIYLTFSQPNYWTQLENNYSSKTDIEADMTVDGVTYPRVGVRFRGNTSYRRLPAGSEKKSFNIELDSFVPGQSLLGYEHLNLNNGYSDPTFMREFMMYMLCRRYMAAPKCNFVRLHLNGQYWGIYVNVQQPNSDMMREWFRSDDGNRYRSAPHGNHSQGALIYLGNSPSNYSSIYEFKKGDGTDLVQLIDTLNNTPSNLVRTNLPKIWNVDTGFWYIACNNIMLQLDSYIGSGKDHSHYHDPVHGDFHIHPFDVNEILGAQGLGQGGGATTSPYLNSTSAGKPAFSTPMSVPDWNARYTAHYREVLEGSFGWSNLQPIIQKYQSLIASDVAADTKKLYSTAAFTQNVTQNIPNGRNPIYGLKPLIDSRETYLSNLASLTAARPTLSALAAWPANPTFQDSINVSATMSSNTTAATLFFRAKGPFIETPMFDDGQHGDGAAGDGVWGAIIPPQAGASIVDYYVGGHTSTNVWRFLPKTAEFQAPSFFVSASHPVVINEFLADNDTVEVDPNGEFDDWVELHNTGTTSYDLTGHYLSDDLANPKKWQFSAGTTISAGGFLRVWCDEQGSQGPLHSNFKLSKDGEQIGLFDTDANANQALDAIVYGAQKSDRSFGRIPDGGDTQAFIYTPSGNSPIHSLARPAVRYDHRRTGNPNNFDLRFSGSTQTSSTASFDLSNGPASGSGLVAIGLKPGLLDIPGIGPLALDPTALFTASVSLDANGDGSWTISVPASINGANLFFQGFATTGFSNALTVQF